MIKGLLKNRAAKNAAWIIACKAIQAALGLVISMLTARYLGPANYGLVDYAASIAAFATPVAQLGFTAALVKEILNHPRDEGRIMGTAIGTAAFSSLLCMAGIGLFTRITTPDEPVTRLVCFLYSLTLLAQSLELMEYWFQAKLISKYSAVATLAAYAAMSAYQLFLLAVGKPVVWFAVAKALEYALISAALLTIYCRRGGRLRFSWRMAKGMLSRSWYYMVSQLLMLAYAQADRVMIKMMLGNSALGLYSAAIVCATELSRFIFAAVINSLRPVILERKRHNRRAYEEGMSVAYGLLIYMALGQSLVICLLARPIVQIMYGAAYLGAVPALRLVVWYTAFAYVGEARSIWILAEGKEKYLLPMNLCGACANVALNGVLIPRMGIQGAALASLVTQAFTNVGMSYLLPPVRESCRYMARGLDPRTLLGFLRR